MPALTGLFAPHWRDDARGTIVGLSTVFCRATRNVARACACARARRWVSPLATCRCHQLRRQPSSPGDTAACLRATTSCAATAPATFGTGTGASPPTSAPGLGLALHIGTGTYLLREHCAWREAAQPVACRRGASHATCRVVRCEPCVITVCVPRPRCGAVQHEGAHRTRAARGSLLPNAGGARLSPRTCIPAGMVGRALPSRQCWHMYARTQMRTCAWTHLSIRAHAWISSVHRPQRRVMGSAL